MPPTPSQLGRKKENNNVEARSARWYAHPRYWVFDVRFTASLKCAPWRPCPKQIDRIARSALVTFERAFIFFFYSFVRFGHSDAPCPKKTSPDGYCAATRNERSTWKIGWKNCEYRCRERMVKKLYNLYENKIRCFLKFKIFIHDHDMISRLKKNVYIMFIIYIFEIVCEICWYVENILKKIYYFHWYIIFSTIVFKPNVF